MVHMFWECARIGAYWNDVAVLLHTCTGRELPFDWPTYLLHKFRRTPNTKVTSRFLDLGMIVAKRLISKR